MNSGVVEALKDDILSDARDKSTSMSAATAFLDSYEAVYGKSGAGMLDGPEFEIEDDTIQGKPTLNLTQIFARAKAESSGSMHTSIPLYLHPTSPSSSTVI